MSAAPVAVLRPRPPKSHTAPPPELERRRARAELADLAHQVLELVEQASRELEKRPAGWREVDRSLARLHEVLYIARRDAGQVKSGVLSALAALERRVDELHDQVAELAADLARAELERKAGAR